MNTPPFVPPQIEIPGNVAEERYAVRVGFLKRVVGLHSAFCALILAVARIPWPGPNLALAVLMTLGSLLGLSLVRGMAKGWRHEQLLSAACVPPLVLGLALLVREATTVGWPLWVFAIPPLATALYTFLCGDDISFTGMFVITALGAIAGAGLAWGFGYLSATRFWEASLGFSAYLLYYVYDLAALQTRRRLGEELGAVLDLFRDLLNFTTYPIRVVNHWRRHRIWSRS